jgi:hypothetical protein
MRPSVAIVDHLDGGHHPSYLRLWQHSLEAHGFNAYIVSPKLVRGVPTDRTHLIPQVRLQVLAADTGQLAAVRFWQETNRWIFDLEKGHGLQVESLAFPYGNPWILNNIPYWMLDRVNSRPWIGLLFNCPKTMLRRAHWFGLSGIASRRAAAVAAFEGLSGLDNWPASLSAGPLIQMPDVAEPMSATSAGRAKVLHAEWKSASGNRPLIACVGRITRRKNVVSLLRAIDSWVGPDRPFVLLAGECAEFDLGDQAKFIRDWFRNPSHGRAQWGRIDDDEFDSYVSAVNMVWACYSNFDGSSNMIAKAAQCESCVLVNPFGAAAVVAQKCAHVEVAEATDDDGLRRSIQKCIERSSKVSKDEFKRLQERFGVTALHNAIKPLTSALLRSCGRT